MQRISNSLLLHTVSVLRFPLLYSPPHAWAQQAELVMVTAHPSFQVGSTFPEIPPFFFPVAQKASSTEAALLFADQEGLWPEQ